MTAATSLAGWVRAHGITASSLDPMAPLEELEPLRELVGDARVVAIGENTHHVREFYLLRHRLGRFLVERCGFTVYAAEAPFTEAQVIDDWLRGGAGTVAEVASAGTAMNLGDCRKFHDLLTWLREHNRVASRPVRFAGTDLPGSFGSPLPALAAVRGYLREADPGALPLVDEATELVLGFHSSSTAEILQRYPGLPVATRDALTATLSVLLARMEILADAERNPGHGTAWHHLRGAWWLDHAHRAAAVHGVPAASAARDTFLAESVLRLLEDGPSDTRIVLACHNWHIQRTRAIDEDGGDGLFPQGYHLARALGSDYVAIAATATLGRTANVRPNPERQSGFEFWAAPLPPLAEDSVEAAFGTEVPLTIADLRAARPVVHDGETFHRMRMADHFMPVEVFDAFDAVAHVPATSCTEHVTGSG